MDQWAVDSGQWAVVSEWRGEYPAGMYRGTSSVSWQ